MLHNTACRRQCCNKYLHPLIQVYNYFTVVYVDYI